MKTFEFLGCFVELNLGCLGLGNLLFKLFALVTNLNCEFLNLEGEFLDLGLVSTTILLKGEVILFLLSGGEGPLFEFLLVPVHLQFELIHTLVSLENHVLDVV